MIFVAGKDRDIHRLDDWALCFAGAINPVDERFEDGDPLIILLSFEFLFDEPIGKCFRFIRRCHRRCSKHEQKQKLKQILNYYFTVYNVNELYSINFLSYFNTIVMLRHYFKHLKLANRFNNNNKPQKESDKQCVDNNK